MRSKQEIERITVFYIMLLLSGKARFSGQPYLKPYWPALIAFFTSSMPVEVISAICSTDMPLQLILALREIGHFKIDVGQFVVEHFLAPGVHQLHLAFDVVGLGVVHAEVEDANRIDLVEHEVPLSLRRLLLDGVGGIVDASVFEVLLVRLLHFDEEFLSLFVFAIDVEHRLAFGSVVAEVLHVEVGEVFDDLLAVEQGVEETDEQFLVDFRAKQLFEGKVGVEVDVSFVTAGLEHYLLRFYFHGKITNFRLNARPLVLVRLEARAADFLHP